jgi:hypothetical protein
MNQNRNVNVPVKSVYVASTRIAMLEEATFANSIEVRFSERLLNMRAKSAPIISGPDATIGKDDRRVRDVPRRPCRSAIKIRTSEIRKNSNAPAHAYGAIDCDEEEKSFFIDLQCTRCRV